MQAVVQISNPCSKLAFFLSSLKSCHCRFTSRKLMSGRLSCTEECEMGLIPHFSRCLTWATAFSGDESIPFKICCLKMAGKCAWVGHHGKEMSLGYEWVQMKGLKRPHDQGMWRHIASFPYVMSNFISYERTLLWNQGTMAFLGYLVFRICFSCYGRMLHNALLNHDKWLRSPVHFLSCSSSGFYASILFS